MKKALKGAQKRTARDRIQELFEQAAVRPRLAKRYVALARKISARHRVRIPVELRRRFCKECNAFLVPGKNCTIRTRDQRVVIRCLECNGIKRIPVR